MRIFKSFLIILTATILFLLPIFTAVYAFRTDQRTDTYPNYATGAAVTTGNVTLLKQLYDSDTGTVTIVSDDSDDTPLLTSYNATSQKVFMSGLHASDNRTLTVSYDIDNFEGNASMITLAGNLPYIFMLVVFAFIPASLFAIFSGRD